MNTIELNINNAITSDQVRSDYEKLLVQAIECNVSLHEGNGKGADFLGWVTLPEEIDSNLIADIKATADLLRRDCEFVIAIGIGGSYLGTKAVVEALSDSFAHLKRSKETTLLYAGNHISEDYLYELQQLLKGRKFGLINISKSGTTTEPALAFRLLKSQLEDQEGKEFARTHIVAITDAEKGALRTLANAEGYKTYIIPDDIGGRFSVLTLVGLLPIAVAGFDIKALVQGAADFSKTVGVNAQNNLSAQYAAIRNALYKNGKKVEILANFHPKMHFIAEWWKQLFGESEGKENKGIFNAAVDLTTDLHSMGQWIQEGERIIFETFLSIKKPKHNVVIPRDRDNLDGLNYIAEKRVDEVNKMAETGTMLAHLDGGVPNLQISLPELNEYYIGQLFYFFEKAVGISGYLLDVNPFDQPGVEAYKTNMFALLEKPGYEQQTKSIKERLLNYGI
ncbi:glucose-6-phosphate isomerase [Porphyromonas sp.]|uniref:glucose-6-phosphate isomerase n=1 Tax=Porphyromonas sp. TaxID=1924944 RepID=UPI0026DBA2C0|nr:glucose-6-phosphate isomerase [Porphyromonas sp.]MDO4695147.1 glucose-6-phosphate isomerase [Porphyromonas sp.]MDO4770209.1 glucose-6-phosphate isomerase [Porphyromonas sp.]